MLRLGPHEQYSHDCRASLRDALVFLKNRLKPAMKADICVEHRGSTWRPVRSFRLAHCEHVVYTDGSRWAFDIDEFGWGGIREPNMGVYASYDSLINGAAQKFVRQWKLAMPVHVAIAPPRVVPSFSAKIIAASLAEHENVEAQRCVDAVRASPGTADSLIILGTDSELSVVLDITCKHSMFMNGVIREWHHIVFRRTDPTVVVRRTADFWDRSRQEFVERTWHPSRLMSWCLPFDEVREMQENFLAARHATRDRHICDQHGHGHRPYGTHGCPDSAPRRSIHSLPGN